MPSVTLRTDRIIYTVSEEAISVVVKTIADVLSCNGETPTSVESVSFGYERLISGKEWLIVHCLPRPISQKEMAQRLQNAFVEVGLFSQDSAHVYVFYDIDKDNLA